MTTIAKLVVPHHGAWCEALKCNVTSVSYSHAYQTGRLYLSAEPKPDLDACVAYFKTIDAKVDDIWVSRAGVLGDRSSLHYSKDDRGVWKTAQCCYLIPDGPLFYAFGFFTDAPRWRLRWCELGWQLAGVVLACRVISHERSSTRRRRSRSHKRRRSERFRLSRPGTNCARPGSKRCPPDALGPIRWALG